jgi:hypothetical protein
VTIVDPATAPFGVDDGPVLSVAFGRNGSMVASGGDDGDIRLRDARTGQQIARFTSDNEGVWSMAFSPDGTVLAIGEAEGTVRVWDVAKGEERTLLDDDIGLVLAVGFDSHGDVLAAGATDGAVRLWHSRAGDRALPAEDHGGVQSAAFSPDDAILAVGEADGTVRVWDVGKGEERGRFASHSGAVQSVASSADSSVQIRFNAWHYMDANLWASLAAEIFFQLASPGDDTTAEEKRRMAREREAVLSKLSTSQRLATELEQAHERAQAQCEQVQGQLNQTQDERQAKVGELAETVGNVTVDLACKLDSDKNLTELRQEAATKLGISEPAPQDLAGLVGELGRLPGLARATWRLLAKRGRAWVWAFGCLAAFLVLLLAGLVLLATRGGQWHGWVAIGVALTTMTGFAATIRPILSAVNSGLGAAKQALQQQETLVQEFQAEQAAKRVKLEAELQQLAAREQHLAVQFAAAQAAEAEAKLEVQDLRAGRRLRKFLEERSVSSDYQGQLSLISMLYKDFQRLDALLRLKTGTEDDDLPRIDRIILYVDDLDRCPPSRVVEVLQAMHLLLALPLFVVVVGVDPRWLLRSLQTHYRALLQTQPVTRSVDGDLSHWASTPQNYLEKIFQIPFALMPMTSSGFAQLVSDLAAEEETRSGGHGQHGAAADRREPERSAALPSAETRRSVATPGTAGTRDAAGLPEAAPGDPPGLAADPGAPDLPGEHAEPTPPPTSGPPSPVTEADGVGPPGVSGVQPHEAAAGPSPAAPQPVEEQRIQARPGSVTSSADDHIDPNPVGLRLTDHEVRFIQALAPMVTTPRAGTRLINIYRMIRSTQATGGSSHFLDLSTGTGDYQAILLLLAIVSSFPELAAPAFEALLRADPGTTWPAFVDELLAARAVAGQDEAESSPGDWDRMRAALAAVRGDHRIHVADGLGPYREWAPRIARFSFAAARDLRISGAT